MIVHVYTIVRNEEYMIKYFLRHYTTFADHIFVVDDNSDDRTRDIVLSYPRQLTTCLLYKYPSGMNEDHLGQTYVDYYKIHSRDAADWVICVDVDEFLYHPNIKLTLDVARIVGHGVLKSTGYAMVTATPPQNGGQIYSVDKMGVRCRGYDKTLVFDPRFDITFGAGRHKMHYPPNAVVGHLGLKLLHYHDLSPEYLTERIRRNFSRMAPSSLRDFTMNYRIKRGLRSYHRAMATAERII